jgi:hypothetical protein
MVAIVAWHQARRFARNRICAAQRGLVTLLVQILSAMSQRFYTAAN